MGKSPEARMSAVVMDGLLEKIPGFESGLFGENQPIFINSPVMSLSTAAANQGAYVAPCDLEIVGIIQTIAEVVDGADDTVLIGTRADPNAFSAAGIVIATTDAVGTTLLTPATVCDGVNTVNISQGDIVEFATGGAGTSTGLAAFTLVCVPR